MLYMCRPITVSFLTDVSRVSRRLMRRSVLEEKGSGGSGGPPDRGERMGAMTLQALLDQVIDLGRLKPSRIGPMRTAIKQYAAILGVPPTSCPPDVYHVPESRLARLIDDHAPSTLGSHGLRNLKNNLRFLFRTSVTLDLLPPLRGVTVQDDVALAQLAVLDGAAASAHRTRPPTWGPCGHAPGASPVRPAGHAAAAHRWAPPASESPPWTPTYEAGAG
jgi:hypothetical protein